MGREYFCVLFPLAQIKQCGVKENLPVRVNVLLV